MFRDRLIEAMNDLNMTQAQLSKMTGIGKSSISQYLSGKNVPSELRQREISTALGLAPDYFKQDISSTSKRALRLQSEEAAKLLGISKETLRRGLQDGVFPWGYAIRGSGNKWVYFINAKRFAEIEGINILAADC